MGSGVQRPGGRQAQTGLGLTGGGPAGIIPAVSQQAHPQRRLKSAGGRLHQRQLEAVTEVGNATCEEGRSEDLPSTRPRLTRRVHVALEVPSLGWGRLLAG